MVKKIFIVTLSLFNIAILGVTSQNRQLSLKDTISDNSLMVPPDMERNYDKLLVEWNKNIKPNESCPINGDQDVSYPDSVYINRLYSFPSRMELIYNPIVRSYIDMYSGRRRKQVAYMLAEGQYYFPLFESALDKYGLPLELKYLPVIESALNPIAVSRMGATGLWQFMLSTGRMYNLEVNSLVDERRDPIKATDAAARYLRDLYNIYGDWNLAIAAYNCGPGNVNKAIRRSNGQTDYWAIYPHLPRETRGYVPAFIAATYIMNFYKEHNICPLEYKYPLALDTVTVNKTVHFQQISDILNIPIEDIRTMNPQYKQDIIPGDYQPYYVCLPTVKIMDFITHHDTIVAHRSGELLTHRKSNNMGSSSGSGAVSTRKIIHKVKKGETLAKIASRYGVTSTQIKKWNKLKSNTLVAGRRLTINKPIPVKSTPQKKNEEVLAQNNTTNTQTTNTTASAETGNTPQANEGQGSDIIANYLKQQKHRNDSVSLDDTGEEDVAVRKDYQEATKAIYHKVRIGETITLIASKYEVEREDIAKWNNLSSNAIKVGQRLVIYIPEKAANEEALTSTTTEKVSAQETKTPAAKEVKPKETTKPKVTKPAGTQAKKSTTKKVSYTVKKGDNLYNIAKRYPGVTPEDIKKASNLSSDKLSIGQKLVIPQKK